jgi:hypothetical protein
MYIKFENNAAVEWPIMNLFQRFPDTSFPEIITVDSLPYGIAQLYTGTEPAFDNAIQKLELQTPALIDGRWVQNYVVVSLSESEITQRTEASAKSARKKRNGLLTASDWTQVVDSPVNTTAWATYRQALRDVPNQSGFPSNITWPTPPTS